MYHEGEQTHTLSTINLCCVKSFGFQCQLLPHNPSLINRLIMWLWKRYIIFFFTAPHDLQDLSFQTRDPTHVPCSGSAESQTLDHQ